MLFIDTEGLGDYKKKPEHDLKIFMLAILVSSHTIFNVDKKIDSTAIDQLGLVVEMAKRIKLSDEEKPSKLDIVNARAFQSFFPALTILIRDAYLELEDDEGKAITQEEYLKACLAH